MGEDVRERTDALDAAGNTTAAIGKGVAIGSAALVALALFGSYITQAGLQLSDASILDGNVITGLLVGAMLPYLFTSLTIKGVGSAAMSMVAEVRHQFRHIPGLLEGSARPDYDKCISICTKASLQEMVAPGALVLLTPVICGILFGTHALTGLLAGSLVSGVQMAISASNTGGAWDNAKKYIEAGATDHARSIGGKGSDAHKAAVVGDTVGGASAESRGSTSRFDSLSACAAPASRSALTPCVACRSAEGHERPEPQHPHQAHGCGVARVCSFLRAVHSQGCAHARAHVRAAVPPLFSRALPRSSPPGLLFKWLKTA